LYPRREFFEYQSLGVYYIRIGVGLSDKISRISRAPGCKVNINLGIAEIVRISAYSDLFFGSGFADHIANQIAVVIAYFRPAHFE
jgi:hypothetical protein